MTIGPHLSDDSEQVIFDADVNGNVVRIEVDRELIEDHLGVESLSPNERLEFVRRNRNQLASNVAEYLRAAPDVTGIHVGAEQLRHCR